MMGGPYCKTCGWFYVAPLGNKSRGECSDPAKQITDRNGNSPFGPPEVHESWTCQRHKETT